MRREFFTRKAPRAALYLCLVLLLAAAVVMVVLRLQRPYGHMDVAVVDAYTLRPLENAVVVLPEHGITAISGPGGRAVVQGIPLIKDKALDALLPMSCGRVTMLVYCEGYLPFALFYAQVTENAMRKGPTIYMFPEGTEGGLEAITVIEAPDYDWVRELLLKYEPVR